VQYHSVSKCKHMVSVSITFSYAQTQHVLQVHFDQHVLSFCSRLYRFPPSHPSYPRPSLLNAVYLIASFFLSSASHPSSLRTRFDWITIREHFVNRTKKSLIANLAEPENLLDFMLATGLWARYLWFGMRLVEGRYFASGEREI
jgi:hypothetical protein